MAFIFGISLSKASENITKLLPVLSRAQLKLKIQPLRKLSKVIELEESLQVLDKRDQEAGDSSDTKKTDTQPEQTILETEISNDTSALSSQPEKTETVTPKERNIHKEIFIDVTERRHFRHKNNPKKTLQW